MSEEPKAVEEPKEATVAKTPRQEILDQIMGDAPAPVEQETTDSAETAPTADKVEEVVKEEESQTEEPSTSSETDVESTQENEEESKEATEDSIEISDEDIQEEYNNKKSNVQKRIDKLTAEKKAKDEQLAQYQAELQALQEKVKKLEQPKQETEEYTMDELQRALAKAREENDYGLELEIQQYIANKAAKQKDALAEKKQLEMQALQKQESDALQNYVKHYPATDDSDLDVNNPASLLVKWAKNIYSENSDYYNQYGIYRSIKALEDARSLILESKLKKLNNKKTGSLEKKLAKEKLKNSLGDGSAGSMEGTQAPSKKKSEFEESFDERMKIARKARLQTS